MIFNIVIVISRYINIELMKKGLDLLVLFFSVVGLIGGICYLFYIKEYWMAVFVGLLGYVAWPEIKRRWLEFKA